jgi:hypothetical protein
MVESHAFEIGILFSLGATSRLSEMNEAVKPLTVSNDSSSCGAKPLASPKNFYAILCGVTLLTSMPIFNCPYKVLRHRRMEVQR